MIENQLLVTIQHTQGNADEYQKKRMKKIFFLSIFYPSLPIFKILCILAPKSRTQQVGLFFATVLLLITFPLVSNAQRISVKQAKEADQLWARAMTNYRIALENQFDVTGANFRSAREDLTGLIAYMPQYAQAYFMRAVIAFSMLDLYDAFLDICQAVRLKPSIVEAPPPYQMRSASDKLHFQGMIALASGNDSQADSILSIPLLKQHLHRSEALYLYRAMARFNLGRKGESCADCQKALSANIPQAKAFRERFCQDEDVVLDSSFPTNLQFFPRGSNDSATVTLSGTIHRQNVDSVYAILIRAGQVVQRASLPVVYTVQKNGSPKGVSLGELGKVVKKNILNPSYGTQRLNATFLFPVRIKAECAEYSLVLGLRLKNGGDTVITRRDSLVAGDAFLFAGQSNMVLGAVPSSDKAEFMRTYNFEISHSWWQTMVSTNALPREMGHIGGFGGAMAKNIVEERKIPVCVIHAALSGTSIEQYFPTRGSPKNSMYDNARILAQQSGLAKNIRGIVWYQGESNTGIGYSEKFAALYRAWKLDYPAVQRVYVVQIRPNACNDFDHSNLREDQRRLPEFFPNVSLVSANAVPGYDGCHFSQQGYEAIAGQVYRLMERDFYNGKDTLDIVAPSLRNASFSDSTRRTVELLFSPSTSNITVSSDSIFAGNAWRSLRDAFLIDGLTREGDKALLGAHGWIENVEVTGTNTVRVHLRDGVHAERITYIPSKFYPTTSVVYDGPWLVTKRGVGVLSFFRASIHTK